MRPFALLVVSALAATMAFGQTHTVPGHYTKSGKWVPAREVADKEKTPNPDKINRDMVKGFKNKPERKPQKPKDPYTQAQSQLGKHREYRYFPGHNTKSGKYVAPAWRWVWVKD
jgi:hypothetical protein